MLSELELEVIKQTRIAGFGMYLHGAWAIHEALLHRLSKNQYPTNQYSTRIIFKNGIQKKTM